jgi:hypothetical protein
LASLCPFLGPSGPLHHTYIHYTGGPLFKNHHSGDSLTERTIKTQHRQKANTPGVEIVENAVAFVNGSTWVWDLKILRIAK